jgi:hypothetical protein
MIQIKIKPEYKDIAQKVESLSKLVFDSTQIDELHKIKNTNKRYKSIVSTTLLLDTQTSFSELFAIINGNCTSNMAVSLSLLIRYLYENHISFLYIFDNSTSSGEVQNRANAFFHFGECKRIKIREKDATEECVQWSKFLGGIQKPNKSQWHGRTFSEIAKEVGFKQPIYQSLSQFAHPGIFSAERVFHTDMFNNIISDGILFSSTDLFVMMDKALDNKLPGVVFYKKDLDKIKKKMKILNDELEVLLKELKNK